MSTSRHRKPAPVTPAYVPRQPVAARTNPPPRSQPRVSQDEYQFSEFLQPVARQSYYTVATDSSYPASTSIANGTLVTTYTEHPGYYTTEYPVHQSYDTNHSLPITVQSEFSQPQFYKATPSETTSVHFYQPPVTVDTLQDRRKTPVQETPSPFVRNQSEAQGTTEFYQEALARNINTSDYSDDLLLRLVCEPNVSNIYLFK